MYSCRQSCGMLSMSVSLNVRVASYCVMKFDRLSPIHRPMKPWNGIKKTSNTNGHIGSRGQKKQQANVGKSLNACVLVRTIPYMASKYGSGFRKSAAKPSSTRKQHISKTMSASDFKNRTSSAKGTSGWGVRSKMGVASSYTAAKTGSSRTSSSSRSSSSRSSSSKSYGGFRGSSGLRV